MSDSQQEEVKVEETVLEQQDAELETICEEAPEAQQAQEEVKNDASKIELLETRVRELSTQLADEKDKQLRLHAELQNVRARSERDVEKAHKFSIEKFAKEILPVSDNLERTLDAADPENEAVTALIEGVQMTQKAFVDAMAKFKLEVVDPMNEVFDPAFHQAMSMVENPALPANTVMHVMQKGYKLHDRLVRPAMVVVSKGGEAAVEKPSIDEKV